jgi:hypothetical protein
MTQHISRPTALALAFINAAVVPLQQQGKNAPWTARRVALNAEKEIGMKSERSQNFHLKQKTYEDLKRRGYVE